VHNYIPFSIIFAKQAVYVMFLIVLTAYFAKTT